MFKKPTKKQFIIRRIALATIATVSVLTIVTVSIFLMLGYRLDSGSGTLSQGALLQFDSQPSGAFVSIDGALLGSRTPNKQTVIAGAHTIEMSRDRYETWSRSLTLEAGTLTWLDYIRLVPTDRPVQRVANYELLSGLKISEDAKWALAHEKADSPTFQLIDLRSEAIKSSSVTLPPEVYTDATAEGVSHTFTLVSWNTNGRYAILKHAYADKTEWIVLDTQDASRSVNVNQALNADFSDVQFASTNGSILFGLSNDGIVRKLDLSARTISRGLITGVESFSVYDGSVITYVGLTSSEPAERVAGVYRDGEERSHVLFSTVDTDTPLAIKTTRYFSNDYVAIAHGQTVTLLRGSYPASNSDDNSSLKDFAVFDLDAPITRLSFSPGGDYVLAQTGAAFTSYEIEHKRLAHGTQVTGENQAQPLRWLDSAHLWSNTGGKLTMRDFDGVYTHTIMNVEQGFDASLSQNGRFFYGVGKSDSGYHLQRVKMILE